VRTDSNGKPQQGISFLMFELNQPGIQIRSIVSISGDHEFKQVFFDEARVPADALIGEENQGWSIAPFLLEHELGGSSAPFLRGRLARLHDSLRQAFASGHSDSEQDDIALTLANAQCRIDALHAWEQQVLTARIGGGAPPCWLPAAPSMGKVLATEFKQHLAELGLSIAGTLRCHQPHGGGRQRPRAACARRVGVRHPCVVERPRCLDLWWHQRSPAQPDRPPHIGF